MKPTPTMPSIGRRSKPRSYTGHAPLWWSLDFNVNPMCSLIGQTVNERIRVLDELVLPDSNTLAACEQFLDRTDKWKDGQTAQPLCIRRRLG